MEEGARGKGSECYALVTDPKWMPAKETVLQGSSADDLAPSCP